ncbi:MAG TPA: hypothetical protein VGQ69_09250 [Gemmatimonadales bacterium]|jgi:hypothetical protein|nr:hypothetical protein [Gemmatimonadales bacterium]
MLRAFGAVLFLVLGCRGAPPGTQDEQIVRMVDSLRPAVERAAGLHFRGPTRSAQRSREEVHQYILDHFEAEFPAERQHALQAVYTLLGLIPDTLSLKTLLIDLLTEQVVGYYDPESRTLYAVRGADPTALRFVLAHELTHALQHDYLPLDSLVRVKGDADRQMAAHAVLEGHAMIVSLLAFAPDPGILREPGFWQMAREQTLAATSEIFSRAPLALREELIFPYLNGAEFMRWWDSAHTGQPLPTAASLPLSTEQILHPIRYATGDQPLPVRFADSTGDVLYEDTLGELEIQVLATVLRGGGELLTETPIGWGGDRFRIYRTSAGPALVWYTAWDDAASARRFLGGTGTRLEARERPGYRTSVETLSGLAYPTVRVVIAPTNWTGWQELPTIRLANSQ